MNIFLVDDDKIYQFTAKKTLESMGLSGEVSVFSDGRHAIEYLRAHQHEITLLPDIIFLDINMPVMDGWQFVEAFEQLQLGKKVSLYMVSSSVDENDMKRSRQYAVINDYIIKPVGRSRFEELLSLTRNGESTGD
ncbi:MAG TPA: response regulator [Chitinophagaceae bacterium]